MATLNEIGERESDFTLKGDSDMVAFAPNHALMARPGRREIDMKPQRIFFYKRLDTDETFAWTEAEAALMLKSNVKVLLRQIGCSNGAAYSNAIRSAGLKPGQIVKKSEAVKILKKAWDAELEAARGHYDDPKDNNVHFDDSFPIQQRGSFVPPA
jgi:hypothetical protein